MCYWHLMLMCENDHQIVIGILKLSENRTEIARKKSHSIVNDFSRSEAITTQLACFFIVDR